MSDSFERELHFLGEDVDVDATDADVAAELAELTELKQWWDVNAPALPFPTPEIPWWRRPVVLAAAAAVVLLAVGAATLSSVIDPASSPPDTVRRMGSGLAVDLTVFRDGEQVLRRTTFHPADRLVVAATISTPGWLHVATVQEDGALSVLHRDTVQRLPAERLALDGAALLDDYEGREWLVVIASDRQLTDAELVDAVDDPSAWVVEVTRKRP